MLYYTRFAAVAQSVERRIGSAEVTGPIPVSSFLKPLITQGFLFFVLYFVLHFVKVQQGHVVIFLRILFDCSSVNSCEHMYYM